MKFKQKLAHWLVGHIPYYIYDYKYEGTSETEKVYRCTLCGLEMRGGTYHWLYSNDGKLEIRDKR